MTLTITWAEEGKAPETFTVTPEVMTALEKYRMSQTAPIKAANGQYATLPKHATIRDLVVGVFMDCLVNPALAMFPPAPLAELQEQARAAQKALEDAKAAAVQSVFVTPESPVIVEAAATK